MRATATPAVAASSGASITASPAVRVRSRLRNPLPACLAAIAVAVAAPVAHPAQPPGDAAAELAANGRLDAALTLLDGWLAEHPGDARLFPVVLQVVTAAPEQRTVEAVLRRYEDVLAADKVGVLRAVPADWAELRGGIKQALDELRRSRLPDAGRRQAVLLLELGQLGDEAVTREAPIALHAGLARAGTALEDAALEDALRSTFAAAGETGGGDGAVAGYGLVALLSGTGRSEEAAAVLAELGRRYPRSPEYALAAAEMPGGRAAGGAWMPPVVALPSPSMLLGSAALACPAPCTIPAVALPQPALPQPALMQPARPQPAAPPPAAPEVAAAPDTLQADAAAEAPAAPPPAPAPAAPEGKQRPSRVVLVPAPAPAPAAGAGRPPSAASAPPAPSAGPPATADDGSGPTGAEKSAAASRPAPRTGSGATPERREQRLLIEKQPAPVAGGGATEPAAVPVQTRVADRAPEPALAPPPAASAVRSQPADATPDGGAASTAAIRVAAAPDHAAAPARAPAPAAGRRIRVTAQPAAWAVLPTDRVFVQPEPGAAADPRSQPARTSAVGARAVAAPSATAAPAPRSPRPSSVRVSSLPDPAAFVVQVGAYLDPDNALEMELKLRQAGFPAVARSYRKPDGSIVHRVGVGGNVTRSRGEQVLTRLKDAGFDAYVSRRDIVSYLPPTPRRR